MIYSLIRISWYGRFSKEIYVGLKIGFFTITLTLVRVRILSFFISLLSFQSIAICQNQTNDCNEKPGAPRKLFAFIGELLQARSVSARENYNEARFSATYRIIDKICGNYPGDTISFDVIQVFSDSSFKKNKYQLLILTKDTAQNENYVLWADLYFDVFKTVNKQWAACYMSKRNSVTYVNEKVLKPKKIKFSKDAFYDTRDMTREEIDITYPEPFYKIKKDKAIPLLGNSIDEIFQHQKESTLANADIYDLPELPVDTAGGGIVVKDVQLEEIKEGDPDSVNQAIEKNYLTIKDSLLKDPFNEAKIRLLLENCRARKDYDRCSQFFDNLVHDYPDSVKAYLLKAKFRHPRASLEDSSKVLVLQQALKVDSSNYDANYELALSYYRLFLQQPNTYYAYTARKWFIRCADIDVAQISLLKYPVIQLSNYLNDVNTVSIYKKLSYQVGTNAQGIPVENKHNWYFPIEPFLRDSTNWITDYTIDIIKELGSVNFRLDWFSEALAWFKEPMLSARYKGKMYRFLWLRSFDAPIVIRMQKIKRSVIIYWKIPRFIDSLHTFQSAVEFKKTIAVWQWKKFEKSLTTIDYWSMISGDYLSDATDGAIWLLEAAINGKYKVTERSGYIYPKYTKCLMYLITLTDLNLPKDRIY